VNVLPEVWSVKDKIKQFSQTFRRQDGVLKIKLSSFWRLLEGKSSMVLCEALRRQMKTQSAKP